MNLDELKKESKRVCVKYLEGDDFSEAMSIIDSNFRPQGEGKRFLHLLVSKNKSDFNEGDIDIIKEISFSLGL